MESQNAKFSSSPAVNTLRAYAEEFAAGHLEKANSGMPLGCLYHFHCIRNEKFTSGADEKAFCDEISKILATGKLHPGSWSKKRSATSRGFMTT